MKTFYSVIYQACRSASFRTYQVLYSLDGQISNGEQLQACHEAVARKAVESGQANSISDVTLLSVSIVGQDLPNPSNYASTQYVSLFTSINEVMCSEPNERDRMLEEIIKEHSSIVGRIESGLNGCEGQGE